MKVASRIFLAIVLLLFILAALAPLAHADEDNFHPRTTSRGEAMKMRTKVFLALGFLPREDIPKLLHATDDPGEPAIVVAGTSFIGIFSEEGAFAPSKNPVSFGGKPFIRTEKWEVPWKGDVLEIYRSEEGFFIWSIRWSRPSDRTFYAYSPFGDERIRSIVARATS